MIAWRPSVRPFDRLCVTLVDQEHIGWISWKLIAWTTSQLLRSSLPIGLSRVYRPTLSLPKGHPPQGNMGQFGGESRGEVGKSGVLEHKSGNISETRKDRGRVTMESL